MDGAFQHLSRDHLPIRMPSDQGFGWETYLRGVHQVYQEQVVQRQAAFEVQWAGPEREWQVHASKLAAQIHVDY